MKYTGIGRPLKEFREPVLKLDCHQCDRHGRYKIENLIARYGDDADIHDVMVDLSKDCLNRWVADGPRRCCAGCDDLIYMWSTQPFREGPFPEVRNSQQAISKSDKT